MVACFVGITPFLRHLFFLPSGGYAGAPLGVVTSAIDTLSGGAIPAINIVLGKGPRNLDLCQGVRCRWFCTKQPNSQARRWQGVPAAPSSPPGP